MAATEAASIPFARKKPSKAITKAAASSEADIAAAPSALCVFISPAALSHIKVEVQEQQLPQSQKRNQQQQQRRKQQQQHHQQPLHAVAAVHALSGSELLVTPDSAAAAAAVEKALREAPGNFAVRMHNQQQDQSGGKPVV